MNKIKKDKEYIDYKQEKEKACKEVDYDCYQCSYNCHCRYVNDEFHCIFDCDEIICPLL